MGFHFAGIITVVLILIPNLLFFILPVRNMPKGFSSPPAVFTVIERIGQAACFSLPVLFGTQICTQQFNVWPVLMGLCLLAYYICWLRYYLGHREFRLLYAPLWIVRIPMAVFPVLYFLSLGLWLASPWIITASLILAIGHLYNSFHIFAQIK